MISDEETTKVSNAMHTYGGSFVKALSRALRVADPVNRQKIKDAFPDYWETYLKKVIRMSKAVLILSGGLDSTTLLYDLLNQDIEVFPVSFVYGQKHVKELDCAIATCEKLGLTHEILNIPFLEGFGGSLTNPDVPVPEGHYASENMKSTVVPNRNMIMLSIAAGYAISIGANNLYYGAHAGDHAIYPDCRPVFISAMTSAISVCGYEPLRLEAPYTYLSKGEIVARGIELGVDYSNTWTCYNGREKACGKCGSCTERLEAFKENNITDPIQYED